MGVVFVMFVVRVIVVSRQGIYPFQMLKVWRAVRYKQEGASFLPNYRPVLVKNRQVVESP